MGRPSSYTDDLAAKICESIAQGKSLTKICKADGMPSAHSVFRWLMNEKYRDFRDNYERARSVQMAKFADELQDIADDAENDYTIDENGQEIVNHENIQRSRLRIDTRKWILAKMLPKKYGDKVIQEISGPDGGPLETKIALPELSASEIRALLVVVQAPDPYLLASGNEANGNGKHE